MRRLSVPRYETTIYSRGPQVRQCARLRGPTADFRHIVGETSREIITVRKLPIPVFLLLLSFFAVACQTSSGSGAASSPGSNEVAAVVNGTKILVGDVDRATKQQLSGQENQLSPLELAAARLQALDNLITQEVLFQRSQKDNLKPTEDEINKFIADRKQESGLTEDAFQKQLKEANQTEQQFREDIRRQMAIQKLYDKQVAQLKVTDIEVEQFFKNNPSLFVADPGVQVSDIIVDPNDNGLKNDVKGEPQAEAKSKAIYTRLKSGSDFATIARGESEHRSSFNGGDLGFIPQAQFGALAQQGLPPGLGAQLWAMKEGDITPPIRDQNGIWHIFKLTAKRTEKRDLTLNDPDVRKRINDAILDQRKQLVNAAMLTRARDESKIENYLAARLLESPNSLGVLRPVPQSGATSPTPAASAAATPAPVASPSPEAKK